MLPKGLKSSYHRYKTDTQSFTSWLVATASSCGVVIGSDIVNNEGTPTISLHNYTVLVDAVVENGIALPKVLESVLERAISIRKRCARFFQSKKPEDEISNKGHWHFIAVMEDALNRLKPSDEEDSRTGSGKDVNDDSYSQLSNRFALLALDESWKEKPERKAAGKKSKKKNKENTNLNDKLESIARYDIEEEYDEYRSLAFFMAFCLFVDLNDLRDSIKDTWTEYKEGTLDAMTAAVTTNATLIVGRNLIDITQSLIRPSDFEGADSLPTTIFSFICLLSDRDHTFRRRPHDLFNLENYPMADWTFATTTILMKSYIAVVDPQSCPFYRKGNWGAVDPSKPYDERSIEEKFDNDREAIVDFLFECAFLLQTAEVLVIDEVTKALRDFNRTKKITMYHSFSSQVLLDIGNILADKKTAPYDDLRMTALRAKKNLTSFLELNSKVPLPTWPAANTAAVQKILRFIDLELTNDPAIPLKQESSPPGFSHTEFHLYKQNPIFTGLVMYDLSLRVQELGIAVTNNWVAVFPTLCLYNLLNNSPSIQAVTWSDFDEFLKVHDEKSFFVGGMPKDLEGSFEKLQFSLDLSPTALAKPGRSKRATNSTKGIRVINATTVLGAAFNTALKSERRDALSLVVMEELLESLELQPEMIPELVESPRGNTASQALKRKKKKRKTLTSLQLLKVLQSNLALEERKLEFNYIGLHGRCFEFLGKLRDRLHDKLVKYYGPQYIEAECQLPYVIYYVMKDALMSASASKSMGLQSDAMSSPMLIQAADLMREYTRAKSAIACRELMVFSKTYKANSTGSSKRKRGKATHWTAIKEILDSKPLVLAQEGQI
ncbi:hypothetical protein TWF694_005180 [Orbilia ellipsospora]|uniref:DUF6604 domain-containing protein n=1 Tax=Orbilia ellipsospora TaxID=2528407 RepID=A0AAV9WVT8_9PEZI